MLKLQNAEIAKRGDNLQKRNYACNADVQNNLTRSIESTIVSHFMIEMVDFLHGKTNTAARRLL